MGSSRRVRMAFSRAAYTDATGARGAISGSGNPAGKQLGDKGVCSAARCSAADPSFMATEKRRTTGTAVGHMSAEITLVVAAGAATDRQPAWWQSKDCRWGSACGSARLRRQTGTTVCALGIGVEPG